MAYVFVQSDGSGNNAVFQFPTSFTSGAGTEVTIGASAGGAEYVFSGAFDNIYFNSESSCDTGCTPTGNLYVGGNTAGPARLYQIPITANAMGTANIGPKLETTTILPQILGRTSPVTEFFNENGETATGSVDIVGDPAGWTSGSRSVTVGGVTYTFVTGTLAASTPTAVQVLQVGSSTPENNEGNTAQNLSAAINAVPGQCDVPPCFGTGTVANPAVSATLAGANVNLAATTGGAAGDFTITETGGGIEFGGGDNGASLDFIFFSSYAGNGSLPCVTGCVYSFDVTSGVALTAGTVPDATLGVTADTADSANGFVTGGIIIDNELMSSSSLVGTSQIYFLSLDNEVTVTCSTSGSTICATQASQSGLN